MPARIRRLGLLVLCAALVACGGAGGPPTSAPPAPEPTDCAGTSTFADGHTPTRIVHLAPDGDDAQGTGTSEAPFATLARARQALEPGTALRLHAGTYAGGVALSDLRGRSDAPIWIGGAPGEAPPVLQGGTAGLHLTRVAWLVLHDLGVAGATHNGVNCDDGGARDDEEATHHVLFRGLTVRDVGTGGNHDGLKLSGVHDYVVLDCDLERINAGSGIDHVGCHRGRIVRCTFRDMGSNAIQCKGGTTDLVITRCTFENAGQRAVNIGGSTGFAYFRPPLSPTEPNAEARRVHVVANVFGSAVTPFAFVGAVDCLVAHNTFQAADYRWLFRVLQETTSTEEYAFAETRDCRVIGNVFHFQRATLSTAVNVGPHTRGDTFTISHNLWYAADDPPASAPTSLPAPETNAVTGHNPFPDAALAPRIPLGSPAAGAGTALDEVTGDHDGRCYADPPSIGAFAAAPPR